MKTVFALLVCICEGPDEGMGWWADEWLSFWGVSADLWCDVLWDAHFLLSLSVLRSLAPL